MQNHVLSIFVVLKNLKIGNATTFFSYSNTPPTSQIDDSAPLTLVLFRETLILTYFVVKNTILQFIIYYEIWEYNTIYTHV